jgi:hypothetical protein
LCLIGSYIVSTIDLSAESKAGRYDIGSSSRLLGQPLTPTCLCLFFKGTHPSA